MRTTLLVLFSFFGLACTDTSNPTDAASAADSAGPADAAASQDLPESRRDLRGAPADLVPADASSADLGGRTVIRIMASNLSSGKLQSYDPGEGLRILVGLKADVMLMQEFNYGDNTAAVLRAMVDANFGPSFSYYREPQGSIPNGVISRFPIVDSGVWDDPLTTDREFVWARVDVPGPKDLWAVSVHLLTSSSAKRDGQAKALVDFVKMKVPAGVFLVIGGDFNTGSTGEPCLATLGPVVVTDLLLDPEPVDNHGVVGTNASRAKPYDWVLPAPDLNALRQPVHIGAATFPNGLVFDSRVYTPLSDVMPVQMGDSGALNMQHMGVIKDFALPN